MQYYVSEYRTARLLGMGLDTLKRIEKEAVPRLYASDPHKLMRCLEDTSILTDAMVITEASLARKASSNFLNFRRIDYPLVDPEEWNKYLTVTLVNGQTQIGRLPQAFWGNMKTQYEKHNPDYEGVYKGQ